MKLPFGKLQPYKPRRFVPVKANAGDWGQIEPLFDQLDAGAAGARTADDLEHWIMEWSELSSVLDEEAARRYIAMTCHTEDPEAEKAYLQFVEEIEPRVKPRRFNLARLFVSHPARKALPQARYQVFDRDTQLFVDLFRPENVPLETEEAKLGQQYEKLSGSLTVQFRGKECTLPQMGRYLEENDRALRQEAWTLVARRRLQEVEQFDTIFDKMLKLRHQMALNAGFANYRDYAFRRLGRFDYGPEECYSFHNAIESEVMPALRKAQEKRRSTLALDTLRPWDVEVDPRNRPPLRPFERSEEMVSRTSEIFDRLDAELGTDFKLLRERRLLDLDNRKGKAPGGYQSNLSESRVPFIFMNAVGVQRDVETLLHEAGHAFHALATKEEDLFAYRNPPIEFCEVASMSMELLGNAFLETFYSPEDSQRARENHLVSILKILPWIATVDAFQHWIYTNAEHSREARREAWKGLMRRFAGDVDYSGFDAELGNLWHRQLHIFTHPFYYIEYGIAQLGALQVWANSKRDAAASLKKYKQALALGGSRPLPELFSAAGCRFQFDSKTIAPLIRLIQDEIEAVEKLPRN